MCRAFWINVNPLGVREVAVTARILAKFGVVVNIGGVDVGGEGSARKSQAELKGHEVQWPRQNN